MTIIIISYTVIILGWGWVLGEHSAEPDLFTPSISYFSNIGAFLGGTGTIALAVISLKALYSWKVQHHYQHRFNSVIKILGAYDELSTLFDNYLNLAFLSNNDVVTSENMTDELKESLPDRLKDSELKWNNFNLNFDSVFENLDILFSDEEMNEFRKGSEFAIGLMKSEISKFSCEHDREGISGFMFSHPKPSQRLETPLSNIKKAVRDMANK